jgi:maltooligosyltrehalose trehalohydrolase
VNQPSSNPAPRFGALPEEGGTRVTVWAPWHAQLRVRFDGGEVSLTRQGDLHAGLVPGLHAGGRYRLVLPDGQAFPDPASRYQPEGVHGPSEVVDPDAFAWRSSAPTLSMASLVLYEMHVGTFTAAGTFEAARAELPRLAELGVTAVELLPLHDFPGARGWGYDPAALFSPCRAYGTPDDLRRFVDDAHAVGLGVFVDVVYNHLGPDGAYLAAFGPVLTEAHRTAWGRAINLSGPHSEGVRELILQNALHWLEEYRVDGLRLDATFALVDDSEEHLLKALVRRVAPLSPRRLLIAEDDRNLAALVRPKAEGGYGLDGVWADDLHHLLRRYVAGDRHGYFAPFPDRSAAIAECLDRNWWRELPGSDAADLPSERFVVCIQNHDQIGNRPRGDRLTEDVDLATYGALSAVLLFAPQTPLLFMGQEWAASTPFAYFTDHGEPLGAAVREGRRREFQDFPGFAGEVPDPQAEETFEASRLRHEERHRSPHDAVEALYRALLRLRPSLSGGVEASSPSEGLLRLRRGRHLLLASLGPAGAIDLALDGEVRTLLATDAEAFGGDGRTTRDSRRAVFAGPAALILEVTP